MYKKSLITFLTIIELLFLPFFGKSAVWAIPEPPAPPEAPAGPPQSPAPPTAPEPPAPPTAPNPPSAPSAPSSPSNNQPQNNNNAPTPPPNAPTAPPQSTNSVNTNDTPTPSSSTSTNDTENPVNQANNNSEPANTQTATNQQTGADSTNESTNDSTTQTAVTTDNQATVNNDIVAISTSGFNHANKNTGDAAVSSGDAMVLGQVVNQANTNQTIVPANGCGSCGGNEQTAANQQTGADSSNQATNNVTSDTLIENNNTANLDTGVIAIADSGHNTANKNTGDAAVTSGDANVGLTVVNVANTDIAGVKTSEFNVYDDHNGDIVIDPWNQDSSTTSGSGSGQSAINDTTGADSSNLANNNSNTSLTIINNNDATVANDLVIDASTGHNQANKNTGDGSITTGDVNVVANVVNLVNNSIEAGTEIWVATVNIFRNLVGDIILAPLADCSDCAEGLQSASNNTTGADSSNQASVAQQRIININQSNESDIRNQMVINANTGGNNTDKNTGGADVQTGQVNVQAEQYTVANTNAVGTGEQTWWIVIVNEAGQWVGKIFGSADGQNVASAGQIDLGAVNEQTGAGSDNQASNDQTQSTTINQSNQALVDTNMVINADTGHNTAEKNTGNSSITTGDVNVMSNVINYVNNNIVGGKVIVAFVNVFGSWLGNVLPPGTEKPVEVANTAPSPQQNSQSNSSPSTSTNSTNSSNSPTPTPTTPAIGGPVTDTTFTQEDTNISQLIGPRRPISLLANAGYNHILGLHTADEENLDPQLASTLSLDDRIAQGIWLTEEDLYLQTSPTPTTQPIQVQSKVISRPHNFSLREQWLLILLALGLPVGFAAYRLKKTFTPSRGPTAEVEL